MYETDDTALLEAARQGDDRALSTLLERRQAQIYRFGLKMCGDAEDAKDVAQDTLLAMARGVGDFQGASSLSTWLYAIARSYCIKKRRRSKFAPAPGDELSLSGDGLDESDLVDRGRTPDELVMSKRLETALHGAILALEPSYREVLVLRDVEGLSAAEVAEVLGLSVAAVKSRLHRARLQVRAAMAPLVEQARATDGQQASRSAAERCPDVAMLFSRYLEGDIGLEGCQEMERHLERCERCRSECDALERTLALCRTSAKDVEVPDAVQASIKAALRDWLRHRTGARPPGV